jgi:hypothetical protein
MGFRQPYDTDLTDAEWNYLEPLNFTDALRSVTSYENLKRDVLQPRLLLCLHGIGTNAGLHRMNTRFAWCDVQGTRLCPQALPQRRWAAYRQRHHQQRHAVRAQPVDLGRWNDGMRF